MEADTQEKKPAAKSKSAASKTTIIKQKSKSKSDSNPKSQTSKTLKVSKSKSKDTTAQSSDKLQTGSPSKVKLMQKDSNQSLQKTADSVSLDQRHQLIATAAYLRAEQRGFSGGDPLEDWLIAESEVDAKLSRKTKPKARNSQTTNKNI